MGDSPVIARLKPVAMEVKKDKDGQPLGDGINLLDIMVFFSTFMTRALMVPIS
jgi:hypothetical protein